uniref:hypothetical protein n=1 Tax=Streptomyces sp. NBC_01001 TaxID=2903713 RepID=UPI002F918B8A|nr:hypothetical protein OG296_38750 [Streptomyces sp. NBC_01001]
MTITKPLPLDLQQCFLSWVGVNADGRLEVFTRGTDGALRHNYQTDATEPNQWSGWNSLGGHLAGNPVVAGTDCLEVFARGTDGGLQHIRQDGSGHGGWSDWSVLGLGPGGGMGPAGAPVAVTNSDGRLEVLFHSDIDGTVQHIWQTSPGSTSWQWGPIGGSMLGDPAVALNLDGYLEAFACSRIDGALAHILQSNTWSDWLSLGGSLAGTPAVGRNYDGYLEVLARGTDGTLKNIRQDPDSGTGTGWSAWQTLDDSVVMAGDPAMTVNPSGGWLEAFATGADGTLYHICQNPDTSTGWANWTPLGGEPTPATPAVVGHPVGVQGLDVFARGANGTVHHRWQTNPLDPYEWSDWHALD